MTQILERLQTIAGVLAVGAFDKSGRCLSSSGDVAAQEKLVRMAASFFARGAKEHELHDGSRVVMDEADGIRIVALGTPHLGRDGATGLSFHLRVAARVFNMEAARIRRNSSIVPTGTSTESEKPQAVTG